MYRFSFLLVLIFLLSCGSVPNSNSPDDPSNPELKDLPAFQSSDGELNLLIEATQKTTDLAGLHPGTWVYRVCDPSQATNDTCPDNAQTESPYGGVRLKLQQGDHLKIRLVNRLPSAPPDAVHMLQDTGMLGANPTNLHTHGLIVEPRRAGNGDPTYGDYVYVLGYPQGKLPVSIHSGLDYTDKPLDYDIYIPPNHPSGLFWFHPHIHGLSLNQITAGLSGVITIGSVNDYLKGAAGAPIAADNVKTRQMLLKDVQVEKNSTMITQQESTFCTPDPAPGEAPRDGFCAGQQVGTYDHQGGLWIHSINGQIYPSIHVSDGEVWRITSASGNRSYDLQLVDDVSGQSLTFQVLSLDGVSLDIPQGTPSAEVQSGLQKRMAAVPCPASPLGSQPLCGTMLHVMPSSRAEIYVSSANAKSASATFLTPSYKTGPDGDDWPAVKLARVFFANPGMAAAKVLSVHGQAKRMLAPRGVLGGSPLVKVPGLEQEISVNNAVWLRKRALSGRGAQSDATTQPATCAALLPGHRRRIFFGLPPGAPPADEEDVLPPSFGLGYEEVDGNGVPVPGTFKDIEPFDHSTVEICLPLSPGNSPVSERWELVNVSGEDHNFHIHQTKFWLVDGSGNTTIMMDSLPLPHGSSGCDGTVASWRSGQCKVTPLEVEIPFSEVGDFVYHCHILEHEDGGMMAHIRVVPNF